MNLAKLNKEITKRVSQEMSKRGWSKYEFCKKSGIPHATMYTLMNTEKLSWNLYYLNVFADVLNVDMSYLIFGEGADEILTQLRERINQLEIENAELKLSKDKLDEVREVILK